MPKDHRKNFRFAEDVAALLDEVGNASEYLARLTRNAERRWRDAHSTLRATGWTDAEIVAACAALNGTILHRYHGALSQSLPLELHDFARLGGLASHPDVSADQWGTRVEQVASNEGVARAVADLAEEFWAGNERLSATLGL